MFREGEIEILRVDGKRERSRDLSAVLCKLRENYVTKNINTEKGDSSLRWSSGWPAELSTEKSGFKSNKGGNLSILLHLRP